MVVLAGQLCCKYNEKLKGNNFIQTFKHACYMRKTCLKAIFQGYVYSIKLTLRIDTNKIEESEYLILE